MMNLTLWSMIPGSRTLRARTIVYVEVRTGDDRTLNGPKSPDMRRTFRILRPGLAPFFAPRLHPPVAHGLLLACINPHLVPSTVTSPRRTISAFRSERATSRNNDFNSSSSHSRRLICIDSVTSKQCAIDFKAPEYARLPPKRRQEQNVSAEYLLQRRLLVEPSARSISTWIRILHWPHYTRF